MTSDHSLFDTKMRLYNVIIHMNFYRNRFTNECDRKISANMPELRKLRRHREKKIDVYKINNLRSK